MEKSHKLVFQSNQILWLLCLEVVKQRKVKNIKNAVMETGSISHPKTEILILLPRGNHLLFLGYYP